MLVGHKDYSKQKKTCLQFFIQKLVFISTQCFMTHVLEKTAPSLTA